MAGSVGTVFYDVLPNLDGFAAKVAAGVGKQKPVKIKVEADTKSAEASAKKLTTVQAREAQVSSAKRMALIQRDAIAENRYRDRNIASAKRASAQKMALIQRDAIAENQLRDRSVVSEKRSSAQRMALIQRDAIAENRFRDRNIAATKRASAQRMALIQRDAIAENRFRDRSVVSEKRVAAQRMALIQRDAIAENRLRDRAAAVQERNAARQIAAQAKISASQQKAAAAAAAQQRAARQSATGSLGTGLLVGGAATLYALKQVTDVTAEFDSAVSNVASTSKEATASIGRLRQEAIKYGGATAFSAKEAADAQAELIKANVSVTDTINGGLKGALDLAAAGSLGVADAAGIMGTTLSQFKLPGTDASHVADLLAAAAGKAQGEVTDFAEALKYVGPLSKSAGVSLEETTGVLAEFADQGILGSQAGTALRGIFLGLTAPVGAGAKAIEKYGINVRDAQGNFIGLEGAAGELQKRLGGLSRAQRDAALAAIFGRNQVTAATILYEEGAAGVQKWSDAVSESGFAARTAATKMDNLKGDVEQLKGAIDSAFIQSGSGGTTFLRGLAQDATETIDSFNSLNPAVQQFAFKGAAIAGASLLAGGALIKLTAGVTSATGGLVALGAIAPATAAKIGTLTAAAGPAAAAFVAVAAGAALLNSLDRPAKSVDELSKSLTDIAAGQGNLNDAFTGPNWAGELAGFLSGGVTPAKDLASALRTLEVSQDSWAGKMKRLQESVTPGTQSIERAGEQVAALDDALVSMVSNGQTQEAGQAIKRLGIEGKDVARFLPQYSGALREAGDAAASSFRASERAFANGGAAASGIKQTGAAASYTADELAAMNAELYASANAALALSGNAIGVEAAMDAARDSIKANGETLDINTQKGRNNQTALNNLASATLAQTSAMQEQGKSAESIAAANDRAKSSWINSAVAMGKNRDKAKELADELFALPTEVTSQIVVSGAKVSAREAKDLNRELKGIPKEQRARIVTIANTKGAKEARTEIAKVKSKNVITKATAKGVDKVKEIDGAIKKLKSKEVRAQAREAGKKAVQALDAAIRKLKDRHVTASANATGKSEIDSLQSSINRVQGKTVYVTVRKRGGGVTIDKDGGTMGRQYLRDGGTVRGVGGPRQDNIATFDRTSGLQVAWTSVGEELVNARSSAMNRDIIKQINANPQRRFGLVGLADGGTIGKPKESAARGGHGGRPLILNIDMGDLGIRRIVTEIVEDRDEYSASIGRMR